MNAVVCLRGLASPDCEMLVIVQTLRRTVSVDCRWRFR